MRTHLRIVAGTLRGRKLSVDVNRKLRPAPQMVREALFSILGDAAPDRPFYDLFAGSGAVGLEALSRGAASLTLVERDHRSATAIQGHLRAFDVLARARVVRADVYRWVEQWPGEPEPINVFIGPPYVDFTRRREALLLLIEGLQAKTAAGSVVALQSEMQAADGLLVGGEWDVRRYGRNRIAIWVKEEQRE